MQITTKDPRHARKSAGRFKAPTQPSTSAENRDGVQNCTPPRPDRRVGSLRRRAKSQEREKEGN